MIRRFVHIIALIVLVLSAIPAWAQTTRIHPLTAEGCVSTTYAPIDGDVLYTKYGPKWDRLNTTNPGLKDRTFVDAVGRTIVKLYPSRYDVLCIPADMNIGDVITHSTAQAESDKPASTILNWESPKIVTASTPWYQNFWIMLLLALLAITAVVFGIARFRRLRREREQAERVRVIDEEGARIATLRERELTCDPVTSGPPIVAGGIPATERQRLYDHFEDQAVASYVRATPGASAETARPNIVRIGTIELGMISGEGMVGYADHARVRRINPAQPGYRARFRFPDGSERELMSLQGCMNPVFYGEGLSGFTFTPGHVAIPVPEPPAPAPTAVPHPAIAVARIRASAESEGRSTILVGGHVMTLEQGVHIDMDSRPRAAVISGPGFRLVVQGKRQRKAIRKAISTGTDSK